MRKAVLLIGAALAGCSMAPHYVRPEAPVPPSWPVGDAYLRQSEAALPAITYRDIFRDARLQSLIEQALANNRDLRIAAANIAAARAQYRVQRANQLPEVGASAGVTTGDSGSNSSSGSGRRTSFSADVGVNAFELDLFGRVASLTRAEQNRYFATEAAARATRLTMIGDIADAWLNYAADASLLEIARQTADSASRSVTLTNARLQGGIAPRTDLRQAEQVLETARADVAEQTTALAQDVNALQLLVGAPIDATLLPARSTRPHRPSLSFPRGWTRASCCAAPMSSRPSISSAPPMPRSAPPAPRCSRASRSPACSASRATR
jgi:multidrug efflux system outer membrane protein